MNKGIIVVCRNEVIMYGTLKECQRFVKALFKSYPNHESITYYSEQTNEVKDD